MSSGIGSESVATVSIGYPEDATSVLSEDPLLQTPENGGSGGATKVQKEVVRAVVDTCRTYAENQTGVVLDKAKRNGTPVQKLVSEAGFESETELREHVALAVGNSLAIEAIDGVRGKMTEVPVPFKKIRDAVRTFLDAILGTEKVTSSRPKPR